MVNPPKPGDASYKQFIHEKDSLLNSLKRRARLMTDAFNALEGVTCQETEGKHLELSTLKADSVFSLQVYLTSQQELCILSLASQYLRLPLPQQKRRARSLMSCTV